MRTARFVLASAVAAGALLAGAAAASAGGTPAIDGVDARYDDPTNTLYLTDTACDDNAVSLTFSIDGGQPVTTRNDGGCDTTTRSRLVADEGVPLRWRACVVPGQCTPWTEEDV